MSTHARTRIQAGTRAAALAILTAAGLGLGAAPAAAQDLEAAAVTHASPKGTAQERILHHGDRALYLQTVGDFAAAGREYTRMANLQRAENQLPARALWMRAEMYRAQGFDEQAADALYRLARESAAFGDSSLQAEALLQAAILYQTTRQPAKVQLCLEQLNRTLASTKLTLEQRRSIVQRMVGV
jgi:tetratricopeptide (TPR) repeat protein